jgi:hypothetical protein
MERDLANLSISPVLREVFNLDQKREGLWWFVGGLRIMTNAPFESFGISDNPMHSSEIHKLEVNKPLTFLSS